jgi:hypothetical protein
MVPWPARRKHLVFASTSTEGFFRTHWPEGIENNGRRATVRFSSIRERDQCMGFLRSRGHDVGWLDPCRTRKSVAKAEDDLRECLARSRSPVCHSPGHLGNERGGALRHALPCGTCDIRRSHAQQHGARIFRASVHMKVEMARKDGKEFARGNPPPPGMHGERRRAEGGNTVARPSSSDRRTGTPPDDERMAAGHGPRPRPRSSRPRRPSLHVPASPALSTGGRSGHGGMGATTSVSRKLHHAGDPLMREPLRQPRPGSRGTSPAMQIDSEPSGMAFATRACRAAGRPRAGHR